MAAPNSSVGDHKTSMEFRETGLRSPVPQFHSGGNQLQSQGIFDYSQSVSTGNRTIKQQIVADDHVIVYRHLPTVAIVPFADELLNTQLFYAEPG